jgi:hypothetical protein
VQEEGEEEVRKPVAVLCASVIAACALAAPASTPAQEPLPFNPTFFGGTMNPAAGGFSPFTFRINRPSSDQEIRSLELNTPPGFAAILRGVTKCSEVEIAQAAEHTGLEEQADPACPDNSLIGRTDVVIGNGRDPLQVSGKVYMSGPYGGAPLSVAVVVPNLAGPFDLGTTVIRSAIFVDPQNARLRIVSDEIPRIVDGIVLDARVVSVTLDRENFSINPTNCDPMAIQARVRAYDGGVSDMSVPFQVGGCDRLGFDPSISARLIGGPSVTFRSSNPGLQVDLRPRPGDANQQSVAFTLSDALQIDQRHLGNICSEAELVNTRCAGRQVIGSASATTPVLDEPLSGPVYAVSGSGGLPRLAVMLGGEIDLLLRASTTAVRSPNGGSALVNTFTGVPDAPVESFRLTINGGPTGYLVNNRDLCQRVETRTKRLKSGKRKKQRVVLPAPPALNRAVITSQNNIRVTQTVPLNPDCTGRQKFTKTKKKKGGKKR